MLGRMVWNPRWNQSLYLISCAERLLENATPHSEKEIRDRIAASLALSPHSKPYWQFRLALVSRDEAGIRKDIAFISPVYADGPA